MAVKTGNDFALEGTRIDRTASGTWVLMLRGELVTQNDRMLEFDDDRAAWAHLMWLDDARNAAPRVEPIRLHDGPQGPWRLS